MNNKIEFYKKNVYGNEHMYIKNKDIADNIKLLTGKKTIDARDIIALENLGFELLQVLPE